MLFGKNLYRVGYKFCWKTDIKQIVGSNNVIEDPFELKGYNTDWTHKYVGTSKMAITPRNTQQVSQILSILSENKIPVVPQGGKTSLVGGSVPISDEVILLLKHMNKIEKFDPFTNILTLESGCVLQNVNEYLKQFDCEMPWDLGARGTCQVGGNVATNCGGINVVKKGLLRNYILGLEVVLPSGEILDLQNTNRKDNTGFDLKQLFIGSEGSLGIITKINVLTTIKAKEKKVLFLQMNTFQDVIRALNEAKKELHDNLYAFELIEGSLTSRTCALEGIKNPFGEQPENDTKYYVLIEVQGNKHVDEIAENFAGQLVEKDICLDCVINKNEKEYQEIWSIREGVNEALPKMGVELKYDFSMPPEEFENFVFTMFPKRLTEPPITAFYGHVGDGNMHFNVLFKTHDELKKMQAEIEPRLFSLVKQLKGSISAEHGVGSNKRDFLPMQKGQDVINVMKSIKQLIDPNNLMNPGKKFEIKFDLFISECSYNYRDLKTQDTQIKDILGPQNVIEDPFELKYYNVDWTNKYHGNSKIAITPRNTEQVSQVLRILNENKIPVVPQGGKTGLVGGGVPLGEEVILLLKHMDKIQKFDPTTNILTLEAGCVLQNVNEYLKHHNCEMPWDLGSRGTCQVGGNVSTNCGGINVVKKGLLRNYILGLEVVLPSGQVLDLTNLNRKDNTGFDLKQLFIGSEGCLGIITKINVLTSVMTRERKVLMVQLKTYKDVIQALKIAKKELHDNLYAFEFVEGRIMSKACKTLDLNAPFNQDEEIASNDYKYYSIVEAQGNSGVEEMIQDYANLLCEKGIALDCVINKNIKEYDDIWALRESLNEAQSKMGVVLKYDLSLPPEQFENFAYQIFPNRKTEGPLNSIYGHVGDGNVHFNIVFDNLELLKKCQANIEPKIFKAIKDFKGSISAEHGVGQNKRKYLPEQKSPSIMKIMRQLKTLFDPNNIMNPGKIFLPDQI